MISPREFAGWQAYRRLEPLGAQRADVPIAIAAAAIVSALTGVARSPADYLPKFEPARARPQTAAEQQAILRTKGRRRGNQHQQPGRDGKLR